MSTTIDFAALSATQAQYLRDAVADGRPIFTTDAGARMLSVVRGPDNKIALFGGLLLDALPEPLRREHSCAACAGFLRRYGGLAQVNADGNLEPVFWRDLSAIQGAAGALRFAVSAGRITGLFSPHGQEMGLDRGTKGFAHLYMRAPVVKASGPYIGTPNAASKARHDKETLARAVAKFTVADAERALAILRSGAAYRAGMSLDLAEWVAATLRRLEALGPRERENMLWHLAASEHAGRTHFGGGPLGAMLDALRAGKSDAEAARVYGSATDPTTHRRSVAPLSDGQIDVAEREVERLGLLPSLERRVATAGETLAAWGGVWHSEQTAPAVPRAEKPAGPFADLRPESDPVVHRGLPPAKTMTLEKAEAVFREAVRVEYVVPKSGPFAFLTAPAKPDAPQLLRTMNGLSWAFPLGGCEAALFGLTPGDRVPARAWAKVPGSERGVFFFLRGAKWDGSRPGGGFATEHLRPDLHGLRKVLDAAQARAVVGGGDHADAAVGVGFFDGQPWTCEEAAVPAAAPVAGGAKPKSVRVVMAVDRSSSMGMYNSEAVACAVATIEASRALGESVAFDVVAFGSRHQAEAAIGMSEDAAIGFVRSVMLADHGHTALNDGIIQALEFGRRATEEAVVYVTVTDGQENASGASVPQVAALLRDEQARANRTVTIAGPGSVLEYGGRIGIPQGNVKVFETSRDGFRDLARDTSNSLSSLSQAFASGKRGTASFFGAAHGKRTGDLPRFVAIMRDGTERHISLDRWE